LTDGIAGELLEAVRRRRAERAHLAGLDRELDEMSRRVLRPRPGWDRLDHAISAAEARSHVSAQLWLEDTTNPAKRIAKRLIAKAVRWYLSQITSRVTSFAQATVGSLDVFSDHLDAQAERVDALGDRVNALADELGGARPLSLPPPQDLASIGRLLRRSPLEFDEHLAEIAVERLKAARGRVLHVDCGSGELVAQLTLAGVDAYGTDPSGSLVEQPVSPGLDLQQADAFGHLRSVASRGLGGVMLSGFVDRLTPGDARRLAFLAGTRVAPAGPIVLVGTHPAIWLREASPLERDLSPGHPLHPETWSYLFADYGFTGLETVVGPEPDGFLVTGTRAG
jgi:Methionine biosynthesis protein MetW